MKRLARPIARRLETRPKISLDLPHLGNSFCEVRSRSGIEGSRTSAAAREHCIDHPWALACALGLSLRVNPKMTRQSCLCSSLFVVFALSVVACKGERDAPSKPGTPAPVSAPPATKQVAPPVNTAPPAPPKADTVDPAGLKAGLGAMLPRVKAKVEALAEAKVEPNEHARFYMHPGEEKTASIEFDTKGLSSLTMAPYIEDFSSNADCVRIPEAGIARLTWYLDGAKKGQLMVDRNYNGLMDLNVAKSSRLKLEVDKGNGVPLCDWFSVGFLNVK